MAGAPKVSIVLTCYNLGKYLDQAVESVLAQTFQDFEILIVNDGSTEAETIRLLADYRRPKTRVVHIDNRGLSGARNEGIRRTAGAYVCTLDADDLLKPTYLEKSVAVLDENPDVAFVSHWLRTFGDEEYDWMPGSPDFPALLDMNSINGAALVRRDALLAVGLFDETMLQGCEDWDIWISMVERGLRGFIIPEVLFLYRRRPDSMSRIMMEGDTHVGLYRYLIEKHRTSFETHLVQLLLRRELDRTTVLAELHDLELDCEAVLSPEVERLRDGLRLAEHRLQFAEEQESATQRHAQLLMEHEANREVLSGRVGHLEAELSKQHTHREAIEAKLGRLEVELTEAHAHGEILAEKEGRLQAELTAAHADGEILAEKAGRLQAELTAAHADGETLAEKAGHLQAELTKAHAQREVVAEKAGRLEGELLRDREGIEGLKFEIRMLRSSLSWRLTRPLRAVYSRLFERE